MPVRRLLASLAVVTLFQGVPLDAEEAADNGKISKRMSDAILAGFRKEEPVAAPAPAPAAHLEVEPEVVKMATFKVVAGPRPPKVDPAEFSIKTEAVPVYLGTGVTEIKGKHHTILIRKLFFIPIAWKLEW